MKRVLYEIEDNFSLNSFAKEIDSSNEFELHEDDRGGIPLDV